MKQILKSTLGKIIHMSGLACFLNRKFPNKDLTVLMYHHVHPKHFEEHIKYIKKNYEPISEQQLYEYYYKNKEFPKNSVLITFDDGYYNNYKYAYPILKKYNVPAVIFLVTGLIGKKIMPWYDKVNYFISESNAKKITILSKTFSLNKRGKNKLKNECYFYMINRTTKQRKKIIKELEKKLGVHLPKNISEEYKFMTWSQVKEIQDVFSIGSHSYNHPILPNETKEEQELQIKKSLSDLKTHGIKPLSFCYPNGDYSQETIDITKKYYKLAYSINFGRTNRSINKYLIQRVGANIKDSKEVIAVKLTLLRRLFNKTKRRTNFKVIHLTNYYFPQTGGLTTAVYNHYTHLVKQKIPRKVLPYPNIFRKVEKAFFNKKIIHWLLVIFYFFEVIIYVAFSRIKYSKIVIHSHSANFCALAAYLCKPFGVKTIHSFHTDPKIDSSKGKIKPRKYLNRINKLTSVSLQLAKDSSKMYCVTQKIEIIYNGIVLSKKKAKKAKHLRLIFIGQFLDIKDPLLFVSVVKEMSKKMIVSAVMCGDGILRNKIEDAIKKDNVPITLLGSIPREQVLQEIANSNVLVLTSKGEGFGNVLLEGTSQGIPVVSVNVGGVREAMIEGKTGLLVDSRRPEKIAKVVLKATKLQKKVERYGKEFLEKKFNLARNQNKYLQLYSYIAKERISRSSKNEN